MQNPKTKNKWWPLAAAALLIVAAISFGLYEHYHKHGQIRQCPEAWIINKLPTDTFNKQDQYMLIDGARHDLKEMDVNWVKQNCAIKGPTVY